jgi:hypothetical protein
MSDNRSLFSVQSNNFDDGNSSMASFKSFDSSKSLIDLEKLRKHRNSVKNYQNKSRVNEIEREQLGFYQI